MYLNEKNQVIKAGIWSIDNKGKTNEILCLLLSSLYYIYKTFAAVRSRD